MLLLFQGVLFQMGLVPAPNHGVLIFCEGFLQDLCSILFILCLLSCSISFFTQTHFA